MFLWRTVINYSTVFIDGFRKVVGADQGGLKAEKDDWQFQNSNFLRRHPHLLENVKRKVKLSDIHYLEQCFVSLESLCKVEVVVVQCGIMLKACGLFHIHQQTDSRVLFLAVCPWWQESKGGGLHTGFDWYSSNKRQTRKYVLHTWESEKVIVFPQSLIAF